MSDNQNRYDLIVIGGGCNGTGIARDAAIRGIKTLLLEKGDWGDGTTGASSRMIHGGIRYLFYDRKVTKISCIDSGYIQNIARNLIHRIPLIIPYYFKDSSGPFAAIWKKKIYPFLMEGFFKSYDHYQPLKNGKKHTHLKRQDLKKILPFISDEIEGAITTDEWGIDPYKLCLYNAISAEQYGADIKSYAEVKDFIKKEGKVIGVKVLDLQNNIEKNYYSNIIVNATGVWTDFLLKKKNIFRKMVRPTKGIHIVLERKISNIGIITSAIDGRQIFIIPDKNHSIIGTTDDDYYGYPDDVKVLPDEIFYLLEGIKRAIPNINKFRILGTFVGIRPTIYKWGKYEDELSRDFKIIEHSIDGMKNLYSVIGGKLAAFRYISEKMVDIVSKKLGINRSSETKNIPLPGCEYTPNKVELISIFESRCDKYNIIKIAERFGTKAEDVLSLGTELKDGFQKICHCMEILKCEIVYSLLNERVIDPTDIIRRLNIGLGSCGGARCIEKVCEIVEEIKGIDKNICLRKIGSSLLKRQAPLLELEKYPLNDFTPMIKNTLLQIKIMKKILKNAEFKNED